MNLLSILIFSYSLSLGYDPGAFWLYDNTPPALIENGAPATNTSIPLYVDFQGEATLAPWGANRPELFAGGGIRDDFYPLSLTSFDPLQDAYTFCGGLRWGPVTLQYRHTCYHPVTPYATLAYLGDYSIPIPKSEGSIDDFSITFSGKIGGGTR